MHSKQRVIVVGEKMEEDRSGLEIEDGVYVVEQCFNFPQAKKDIKILIQFISVYCAHRHQTLPKKPFTAQGKLAAVLEGARVDLCESCGMLLMHGATKHLLCPFDPKPRCKKCTDHCYSSAYRQRIREVMRFSGAFLIRRGRLDLLYKYFF